MTKVFDIAILGYYGFGNLGDELLLEAVISLLLMSGISKEKIVILSNSPAETEEKYGVKSINRWNVKGIFNTLLKSKSFLLGGGGLFQDVTSIKSVLYYWFMIKLAQLAHAKPWAVGQSVGPLKRNVSRNFTKNAFKSCINVVARDVKSYSLLSKWGANVSIAPDLVLSFPVNTINFSARDTVLFNIRPGYESLAHDLVDFVVKNSVGKEIIGVAFSQEDFEIIKKYTEQDRIKVKKIVLIKDKNDFASLAMNASLAVGMRFHFIVLSWMYGVNIIAAEYDPKVETFCNEHHIPSLSCLHDLRKVDLYDSKYAQDVYNSFNIALMAVFGDRQI